MLNFIAIDVETANANMSSICQIGIAKYIDDQLVDEWVSLIDPEDYFDFINTEIHGITEEDVIGSPTLPDVIEVLGGFMNNNICVCHTHFDRVSIKQALTKYGFSEFDTTWLDSASVVRRTWSEFSKRGYGLQNVCKFLGYKFKHHDALEDAKAAGYILIEASRIQALNIDDWLVRVKKPMTLVEKAEVNTSGDLYGEIVVFTGSLEIPRGEATIIASSVGCQVKSSVTKTTTILVVGDQDIVKLAGHKKSSKHRKAEELILKGASIRILRETDFKQMVSLS